MKEITNKNYTWILHKQREENGFNLTEAILMSKVAALAQENSICSNWCYASKETLAQMLGVSRTWTNLMLLKMVAEGKMEKDKHGHYRPLIKWIVPKVNPKTGKVRIPKGARASYINHVEQKRLNWTNTEYVVMNQLWSDYRKCFDEEYANTHEIGDGGLREWGYNGASKKTIGKRLGIGDKNIFTILNHFEMHGYIERNDGIISVVIDWRNPDSVTPCNCERQGEWRDKLKQSKYYGVYGNLTVKGKRGVRKVNTTLYGNLTAAVRKVNTISNIDSNRESNVTAAAVTPIS